MTVRDYFGEWEAFTHLRKPKIAAVQGYALGGGCELMMMCDFAIAGKSAKFGQPEIKLGVIAGLIARVVEGDAVLTEAIAAATQIAGYSRPALRLVREAVNRAEETSLAEGLLFERRTFNGWFGSADQREGMQAFLEKRPASFTGA